MRIAMLVPSAGSALLSGAEGRLGGMERQIARLGRELVARDFSVSIIAYGDAGESRETESGVVWPVYPKGGLPLLKVLFGKLPSLVRFLKHAQPDLIVTRGASELVGMAALLSRLRSIPHLHMLSSDTDLEPGREILPHPQDMVLYRMGLVRADMIVAQSRQQSQRLHAVFGRKAKVLPSFAHGSRRAASLASTGRAVLWGGNLRPVKRPEWVLSLARSFPQTCFIIFGAAAVGHEEYATALIEEFCGEDNIEYLGQVSPEEFAGLFPRSGILLLTSSSEGYPNVFLDAWEYGLTILSTQDPDGMLEGKGLGRKAESLSELRSFLQELLHEGDQARQARQERVVKHFRDTMSQSQLAEAWQQLVLSLVKPVGSGD